MAGASVSQIPVRMCFPQLYLCRQGKDANHVNKEYMEMLYDKGLHRAAQKTLPQKNLQFWPTSFSSEVFRAGNEKGRVSFTQRQVPEEFVDAFFEALYLAIDDTPELSWAKGFFLQIQAQGTKEATAHVVDVPQMSAGVDISPERELAFRRERTRQIARAIRPIDMAKLKPSNWLIDIATTISLTGPDYSLLVRKEMHARFIALLTGVSLSKAEQLIDQGSRGGYAFDELFHTGIYGGFRLTLPSNASPWKIPYVQVYSTDKTLTAHKENGKYAKELEPARVFRDMKKAEENFLTPLIQLTLEAIQEKRQVQIRGECRVRLPYAWDVHRKYEPELLILLTGIVRTTGLW